MAETLVEKKICEACGADVRSGSLFCYNCGGAVSLDLPESGKNNNKMTVREALLNEDLAEKKDLKTARLDNEATPNAVLKPIDKPADDELLTKIADQPIPKPNLTEEAQLKSAANMRRKAKTFQKKTIEKIVWEEPENAPNKWFPIFAILLILVVVAIFYMAMYLK